MNAEGCRSQQLVPIEVVAHGGGCGLLGIEPLLLLGWIGGRRALRRGAQASR